MPDERPRGVVGRQASPARLIEDVEHLAVDVELKLRAGAVADADGGRALVAGKPVQLDLEQAPLAGGPVHDLKIVGVAGHCRRSQVRQAPASSTKPFPISAASAKLASRSQQ